MKPESAETTYGPAGADIRVNGVIGQVKYMLVTIWLVSGQDRFSWNQIPHQGFALCTD